MKITHMFKGEESFEEISKEEAIDKLEGRGFYRPGTVESIFDLESIRKDIQEKILETSFAVFTFIFES